MGRKKRPGRDRCGKVFAEYSMANGHERGGLTVSPDLRLGGRKQLVERHDAGQRAMYVAGSGLGATVGRDRGAGTSGRGRCVPLVVHVVVLLLDGYNFLRLTPYLVLVQLEAGHDDGHNSGTGEHDEQRAEPVHRHAYAVHHVLADPSLEYGHRVRLVVRRERQVGLRDYVVEAADAHVCVAHIRYVHRTPAPASGIYVTRLATATAGTVERGRLSARRRRTVRALFRGRRFCRSVVEVTRSVRESVSV